MLEYFSSLNFMTLVKVLPGDIAQGLIWGVLALGVFITYKILDLPISRWTVRSPPAAQSRSC